MRAHPRTETDTQGHRDRHKTMRLFSTSLKRN
jgi:hypothetical protein